MKSSLIPVDHVVLWILSSAVVFGAGRVQASPLAANGNNAGETHTNENHVGQSLVYDDISNGNLNGSDFANADLTGADLFQCSRYNVNFNGAVLHDANLRGGYAVQSTFVGADLSGADVSGNDSFQDDFTDANLSGATLDTYLDGAIFKGSILVGAKFPGADLFTTDFRNTNLSGANFAGAGRLDQAIFGSTDYSSTTIFPAGFSPAAQGLILVPEPPSWLLLAIGLAALLIWRATERSLELIRLIW